MSRTRILSALAALVAAALACTGFALIGAPANASPSTSPGTSPHRVAKKPVRPKVGQCRTTTFNQAYYGESDPRRPVPCWKPHRLKTFAVVTPPKRFDLDKLHSSTAKQKAFSRWVGKVCGPRFNRKLGGSHADRAQVSYTWWTFIPTKSERRRGARWLRCDLSLVAAAPGGSSYVPPLPNLSFPMIGSRPITDVTRRCLANENNDYWTTCNRPHVARSDRTFVVGTTAYPSQATVNARAEAVCPGERVTWPTRADWTYNERVFTCYSVTTS